MAATPTPILRNPSREQLLHQLYEAAELEHNLMCTYLYAAFSLRQGDEGLGAEEGAAVARWREAIVSVAIDEMSHLAAVWNITAALGGVPRFGRSNFPLDAGLLPASVVVKLAPFSEAVLQHFIFLERPANSSEPEGAGFVPERQFLRSSPGPRVTPMAVDYDTVGTFYAALGDGLRDLVARVGEDVAFDGDRAFQLSAAEIDLPGAKPVICLKTALAAFDAIILQGEGATEASSDSHFARFCAIRAEYRRLKAANPAFAPAHPAATNPVLRRPPRPEGRVWIEDDAAIATVDLANASYGLMLRLLGYAYSVRAPEPDKALAVDLAIGLMQAVTPLGERAARLPAGPSNPHCNAGMSFTSLRDASGFQQSAGARRFFVERLRELAQAAGKLPDPTDARVARSTRLLEALAERAASRFDLAERAPAAAPAARAAVTVAAAAAASDEDGPSGSAASHDSANGSAAAGVGGAEPTSIVDGVEIVEGKAMTLMFEARRCIHARFCVTGAPTVFLANVKGPWLHPDTLDVERLAAVSQECPSGAIRYRRKDGRPDEVAPPVNLAAIREAGPYAVRGELLLDGRPAGFRATLCRCGASKNKPFCDSSHHDIGFTATGEPASGKTDMLPVRDGPLAIDPQPDGPLKVRGNLEITSGTGRVVARLTGAALCRCGGSANKPFCDGTHAKIGFRS
jgi:CDGSH-type Zn-finger protein/uncharacterized Fe-S cluster protein YjdI